MNKLFLIFSIILSQILMGNLYAQENSFLKREDGSSINFYLKKSAGHTLLVLMQGSDCNSVAHNKTINNEFSKVVPDADVLTVEKYGITESVIWNSLGDSIECPSSYFQYDSPQQRVNDYLQAISFLNDSNEYRNIILLGGSEGALIAMMVASQHRSVSAVISLNGGGRFFIDDVLYNMSLELPQQAFEEAEKEFMEFHDAVTHSDTMDVQMSGHGFLWWKEMLTIDQTDTLLKVYAPLLIIQSEQDKNVSPTLATEQSKFLSDKKTDFKYMSLKGLDHRFKDTEGKSHTSEVIELFKLWAKKIG